MKHLTIRIILFFLLIGILNDGLANNSTLQYQNKSVLELYNQAILITDVYPDSARTVLLHCKTEFEHKNNIEYSIKILLALSDLEKNQGNYGPAYDYLWDALLLCENYNFLYLEAEIHKMLGMLYGIFSNDALSIFHKQQTLKIKKQEYKQNKIKLSDLVPPYFSLAVQYSRSENYNKALAYLDSCRTIRYKTKTHTAYIDAEEGYILLQQNKLNQAELLLNKTEPYFEKNELHFLVLSYFFKAELLNRKGEVNNAITYYNKSLNAIDRFNSHSDIRPQLHEALALIYAKTGRNNLAFNHLTIAKQITDSLFSARSNSDLLVIKNKYRETIQQKDLQISSQNQQLKEQALSNFRLKAYLALILLFVAVTFLIIRIWYQRKKFKTESDKIELTSKLNSEKMEAVMEVKNKEITSFTLQLIDKERIIEDLLGQLKSYIDHKQFKLIENSTKENNKNLWLEFNKRFTEINSEFYAKLQVKYPNLTPTELKHCALLKLNFSGKEMAQLLNISVSSIHIARHRLRKKFDLQRDQNLIQFIADI